MARRGKVEVTVEEKQNEVSYLQPEILPVQVMVDVLKERGMKSATLQQVDRAQIIAMFYKHVSPKHQRDYRDNRRGKILKKIRQRREIKTKDEDWKKLVVESKDKVESKDRPLVSTDAALSSSAGKERLKPPPSCINSERKKIKLRGSAKTSGDLDFIVIKRRSSEESESSPENKVKRLSQEEGDSKDKRKEVDESQQEAKKLKVENGQEKQSSDLVSSENGKKEKVKRKPISWP
ncbi:uncharacterized protein [Panulirus ornatus]|uniref:uncharacterized protein n=1 Tax=Panulirus ornatus TaxID=150431 RepID=UPI003A86B769